MAPRPWVGCGGSCQNIGPARPTRKGLHWPRTRPRPAPAEGRTHAGRTCAGRRSQLAGATPSRPLGAVFRDHAGRKASGSEHRPPEAASFACVDRRRLGVSGDRIWPGLVGGGQTESRSLFLPQASLSSVGRAWLSPPGPVRDKGSVLGPGRGPEVRRPSWRRCACGLGTVWGGELSRWETEEQGAREESASAWPQGLGGDCRRLSWTPQEPEPLSLSWKERPGTRGAVPGLACQCPWGPSVACPFAPAQPGPLVPG